MAKFSSKSLIGIRFGRFVVIGDPFQEFSSGKKRVFHLCLCDCGNKKNVRTFQLTSGISQSCGCLQKEGMSARQKTHGMHSTRIYAVWASMLARCNTKTHKAFVNYGGRGINVCSDWNRSFESFKMWADISGYEIGLSIDRRNNDDGYSPENCRWITRKENNRNRRISIWIEAFGERKTIDDWAIDSRCSITRTALARRFKRGISPESAISNTDQRRKNI